MGICLALLFVCGVVVRVMAMDMWLRLICTASGSLVIYVILQAQGTAGVSAGGASASALLVFVAADFVGCCIENVQRRRFMERKGSMANELEAAEPAADLALAKSVAGWPMRV